jgi:O-antigen ligase
MGFAVIAILLTVIPFISELSSNGMDLQKMIDMRVQTLVNQNDFAAESRIVTSVSAWGIFVESPIWGKGIGYPIYVYSIEDRGMVEAQLLHNSALYYGIKIGTIGLFSLIWLMIVGSRSASRIANEEKSDQSADEREIKAFAQAMISGMIPFFLIGPWSGNLNYFPFMMPLGLFIGLNWELILANARPNRKEASALTSYAISLRKSSG